MPRTRTSDPRALLSEEELAGLGREDLPRRVEPMLATLTDERFSDRDWVFERKLDGVRVLVHHGGGRPRLVSRNGENLSAAFPELVEELSRQPDVAFVADGEVVAFRRGVTSFERLQGRIGLRDEDEIRARRIAVYLYLFDLLHLDGRDLRPLPLRRRKALLRHALRFGGRVRFVRHDNARGEDLFREACRRGWEGLIAKDARSPYAGGRSRKWLKFKCSRGQELVIGGFTDPRGSREGFGALLVGHFDDGDLRYAGKVGTGFDDRTLRSLVRRMRAIERKTSPFADEVHEADAHWVRPELVGEFAFTEWTREGRLRHPRFLGLRADKDAREVRRERAIEP